MLPAKRLILNLLYCVLEIDLGGNLDKGTTSYGTLEKRADVAGARWMPQFAQRLGLNLTNALTRYGENLSDFFERVLIAFLFPRSLLLLGDARKAD